MSDSLASEPVPAPMPVEICRRAVQSVWAAGVKGTFFTLQKAAKYVSDNGRIIYIGSSTTCNAVWGGPVRGEQDRRAILRQRPRQLGQRSTPTRQRRRPAIDTQRFKACPRQQSPQSRQADPDTPEQRHQAVCSVGRSRRNSRPPHSTPQRDRHDCYWKRRWSS